MSDLDRTFSSYGSGPMFEAVAAAVNTIEVGLAETMAVHTITLVLNGQHGEFDLTVLASDENLDDHTFQTVAYRNGGLDEITEAPA